MSLYIFGDVAACCLLILFEIIFFLWNQRAKYVEKEYTFP